MKNILSGALIITLYGCSTASIEPRSQVEESTAQSAIEYECEGSVDLPAHLADKFIKVDDSALLNESLGEPEKGKLCQGQVYQSKKETQIVLHRAWNSTNPYSKMGKWWAFEQPTGKVSQYREEYEICYQWSPLDKLVSCTLEEGTTLVVGNGQSAMCSEYLTYPTSETQQVYISDASTSLGNCTVLDGEFSWK